MGLSLVNSGNFGFSLFRDARRSGCLGRFVFNYTNGVRVSRVGKGVGMDVLEVVICRE